MLPWPGPQLLWNMPILSALTSLTSSYIDGRQSPVVTREDGTYSFVGRECVGIDAVTLLCELKGRDDERCETSLEPRHDLRRAEDARAEVGANPEVDIEHHDILGGCQPRSDAGEGGTHLGTSEVFRNVPPHVELAVEGVVHEVNIDVLHHQRRRIVHRVERLEEFRVRVGVADVHRRRDGTY